MRRGRSLHSIYLVPVYLCFLLYQTIRSCILFDVESKNHPSDSTLGNPLEFVSYIIHLQYLQKCQSCETEGINSSLQRRLDCWSKSCTVVARNLRGSALARCDKGIDAEIWSGSVPTLAKDANIERVYRGKYGTSTKSNHCSFERLNMLAENYLWNWHLVSCVQPIVNHRLRSADSLLVWLEEADQGTCP